MVDLHPVTTAPRVPAHGADHAGIGRVNECAAGCGEILAPVELPGQAGEWVDPQPEGGARDQHFKRRVEFPGGGTVKGARSDVEIAYAVLVEGLDRGTFK